MSIRWRRAIQPSPSARSCVARASPDERTLAKAARRRWPQLQPYVPGQRTSVPFHAAALPGVVSSKCRYIRAIEVCAPLIQAPRGRQVAKGRIRRCLKSCVVAALIDLKFGSCPNWVFPEACTTPHPYQCVSPERPIGRQDSKFAVIKYTSN